MTEPAYTVRTVDFLPDGSPTFRDAGAVKIKWEREIITPEEAMSRYGVEACDVCVTGSYGGAKSYTIHELVPLSLFDDDSVDLDDLFARKFSVPVDAVPDGSPIFKAPPEPTVYTMPLPLEMTISEYKNAVAMARATLERLERKLAELEKEAERK